MKLNINMKQGFNLAFTQGYYILEPPTEVHSEFLSAFNDDFESII